MVENYLNQLMGFLSRILNDDNPSEISFEEIYHSCYKICINKGELELLNRLDKTLEVYLIAINSKLVSLRNEDFYEKLLHFYFDYLNKINVIQKTMMYLENNYLSKKGSNVMIIAKTKYKSFIFKYEFEIQLRDYLMNNLNKDRNKTYINKLQFCNIIKMIKDVNEIFYFQFLEEEILKQSTLFFKEEYLNQISIKNSEEYIDFVYLKINEETNRINDLNLGLSKAKLIKIITSELVITFFNNDQLFVTLLNIFIKENSINKIMKLYEIAGLNNVALELLFVKLSYVIEEIGKDMIKSEEENNIQNDNSCCELVKNIMTLCDKVETLKTKLNILNDKRYSLMLNQHINNFINFNNYKQVFPKLLAKYMDFQFRNYKTKYSYDEILIIIEKSLKLFKFIEEKDIFEQFYRRFLATKLLSNIYYEEIEAKIISNLKIECGAIFTHRCEVMINDIKLSENMYNQFRTSKYYNNPGKIDFGVKILTQGNWPITCLDSMNIPLIEKKNKTFEFLNILDHFKKFFLAFYPGKKLNFKINLGNADIVAKINKGLYFLNLSTLQAFICLVLNKCNKINYNTLLELLQIKEVMVANSHISPLIKSGLLLIDEKKWEKKDHEMQNDLDIKLSSTISINMNFYSKHSKIKYNLAKNNEKIITSHKPDAIEAERKYLIEASIIRIMKNKKMIEHNELTNEVIKSLNSSFLPHLLMIKQRIESLIERQYLKRSEKNYNFYIYTD